MASEMVERVARAIYDEMDLADSLSLPEAERYARAAIAAMRESTEGMIKARFNNLGKGGKVEYQAMIDAALQENPNK